jgi:hypothetical protein
MSRLFFPLRSNTAWFASDSTLSVLERRMKNYLMLYDELVVQDGRYLVKHSEKGVFDYYTPAGQLTNDRSKVSYYSPDDPFVAQVADNAEGPFYPIFQGPITDSYEVDFFPLLYTAGLTESKIVRWWNVDIGDAGKNAAGEAATADTSDARVQAVLPADRFTRGRILKGLYIDSLLAQQIDASFSVDSRVAPVIEQKCSSLVRHWAVDPTGAFHQMWISLMLPDFGGASWDDVLRARESSAGKEFRLMISRIIDSVAGSLSDIESDADLSALLNREFNRELVHEVRRRRAKPAEAALNLLLNFIPAGMGSFVSVPNDMRKVVSERRSWVTFLDGVPRGLRIGK